MPGGHGRRFCRGGMMNRARGSGRTMNFESTENKSQDKEIQPTPAPTNKEEEIDILKQQAETLKNQLDIINSRMDAILNKEPVSKIAIVDDTLCNGCGRCESVCPNGSITLADQLAQIDPNTCTVCGRCVTECPQDAISFNDQVLKEIE